MAFRLLAAPRLQLLAQRRCCFWQDDPLRCCQRRRHDDCLLDSAHRSFNDGCTDIQMVQPMTPPQHRNYRHYNHIRVCACKFLNEWHHRRRPLSLQRPRLMVRELGTEDRPRRRLVDLEAEKRKACVKQPIQVSTSRRED